MAQFALYRSVRGVRSTIRLVEEADGVPIALRAAVRTFATEGIAKDGKPTGLEYAVIFTGTVVLLRPRWTKFDDAARLRALLLDDPDARVTNTIAYRLYAAAARLAESPVAIDLRRVFAAAQATTGATLARMKSLEVKLTAVHAPIYAELWNDGDPLPAVELPDPPPPVERDLIAAIVDDPADPDAIAIYGDWLEQSGRLEEARELR